MFSWRVAASTSGENREAVELRLSASDSAPIASVLRAAILKSNHSVKNVLQQLQRSLHRKTSHQPRHALSRMFVTATQDLPHARRMPNLSSPDSTPFIKVAVR